MNVRNTIIGPNNSYLESCGKACVPDNERPGELFVQFPAQLVGDGTGKRKLYQNSKEN